MHLWFLWHNLTYLLFKIKFPKTFRIESFFLLINTVISKPFNSSMFISSVYTFIFSFILNWLLFCDSKCFCYLTHAHLYISYIIIVIVSYLSLIPFVSIHQYFQNTAIILFLQIGFNHYRKLFLLQSSTKGYRINEFLLR